MGELQVFFLHLPSFLLFFFAGIRLALPQFFSAVQPLERGCICRQRQRKETPDQLPRAISALTSSSVGGFSGSGKREMAMPEQALAKRTSWSSVMPCSSA